MKMQELDNSIEWAEKFLLYARELKRECDYSSDYTELGIWPERGDVRRMAVMLWRSLPRLQK
jgi:hypothetical protein